MAVLSLIRRELKNARIYFIPAGELVDGVTVANAAWPDNNPVTNWTAYQFSDIETVKEQKDIETEDFKIPRASGGYLTDSEETLLKRFWNATTARTNSTVKQLEHALPIQVASGVAQTPFTQNNNYIDGVLLLEIQNKNGQIIERTQVWGRLRLVTSGDVGPSTAKVEFSVEQRESPLNSFVAY